MFYIWSMLIIIKPALISILHLYVCLASYSRPLCSRPMMLHHVTCHVTAVSCASSLSRIKKKRKAKLIWNQKKKKKEKSSVSKVFYNTLSACFFVSSCNFLNVAPTSSCIFFILFANSVAFFIFSFLLISVSILSSLS